MICGYCVVTEESSKELAEAVRALMRTGYQPLGGVSVCFVPAHEGFKREEVITFSQAMTKELE